MTDAWTDALNRTMSNMQDGSSSSLPVTSNQSLIAQTLKDLYATKTLSSPACQQCDALLQNKPLIAPPCAQAQRGGGSMAMKGLLWFLFVILLVLTAYMLMRKCTQRRPMGAPHKPASLQAPPATPNTKAAGVLHDIDDPAGVVPTGPGVTFVLFHASWCGHCKQLMPHFQEMAKAYPQAKFNAVSNDVLSQSPKAQDLGIQGFPTMHVYKNGQAIDSMVGNQGPEKLKAIIEKALQA